jgi:hypothetical protein
MLTREVHPSGLLTLLPFPTRCVAHRVRVAPACVAGLRKNAGHFRVSVAVPCTCPAEDFVPLYAGLRCPRVTLWTCSLMLAFCVRCLVSRSLPDCRTRVALTSYLYGPLKASTSFAASPVPFHRTPKVARFERVSYRRQRDYAVACGGSSAMPPPRSAREPSLPPLRIGLRKNAGHFRVSVAVPCTCPAEDFASAPHPTCRKPSSLPANPCGTDTAIGHEETNCTSEESSPPRCFQVRLAIDAWTGPLASRRPVCCADMMTPTLLRF